MEEETEVVKLVVRSATEVEGSGDPQARLAKEADAVVGVVEATMVAAVGKEMMEAALVAGAEKVVGAQGAVALGVGRMVGGLKEACSVASKEAAAAHLGSPQAAEGWEVASTVGVAAAEGVRMDEGRVAGEETAGVGGAAAVREVAVLVVPLAAVVAGTVLGQRAAHSRGWSAGKVPQTALP